MLIRCPECRTWFKVTDAHIEFAQGRVHCGRCNNLFDAKEHLADTAKESIEPQVQAHVAPHWVPLVSGVAEPPAQTKEPTWVHAQEPDEILRDTKHDSRWTRFTWIAGVTLLGLIIGLQSLWWWRDLWAPTPTGLRLLQALCQVAPCNVQPPKALDQIEVLERALEPHPDRPDALRFRLRMVNRADRAQPYPILELSRKDQLGRLAGIRRFAPDRYLPQQAADLMLPDMPTDISLDLAAPEEHVIGFEIEFL